MMRPRTFSAVQVAAELPCSRDRFRRWIAAYTPAQLRRSLNMQYRSVLYWKQQGKAVFPTVDAARKIILLSEQYPHGIGPLTYEDIFGRPELKTCTSHSYGRGSMMAPRQVQTRRPAPSPVKGKRVLPAYSVSDPKIARELVDTPVRPSEINSRRRSY